MGTGLRPTRPTLRRRSHSEAVEQLARGLSARCLSIVTRPCAALSQPDERKRGGGDKQQWRRFFLTWSCRSRHKFESLDSRLYEGMLQSGSTPRGSLALWSGEEELVRWSWKTKEK